MNTKRVISHILFLTGLAFTMTAQVGIGTVTPSESSILDLNSNSLGLLIPRISLTSSTDTTTISGTEEESLLIYNTATINDITPGFYYWDGVKWIKISTENPEDWSLLGNNDIDEDVNFFGTTTDQNVIFRTNNTDRMVLNSPRGQLIIGPELDDSSTNDLLKVASDIEIGGGPDNFDFTTENILINGESETWWMGVVNEDDQEDSYYFITNDDRLESRPFLLITPRGRIAIGGDDRTPEDQLHIVDDQNDTTILRIDNTESSTDIIHTAFRLYDGDIHKASFQHNNFTNVLEIGHEEATGSVEVILGGDNKIILEADRSVTMEALMNLKPGNEPTTPDEGDVYYDAITKKVRVYNGTIWEDLN